MFDVVESLFSDWFQAQTMLNITVLVGTGSRLSIRISGILMLLLTLGKYEKCYTVIAACTDDMDDAFPSQYDLNEPSPHLASTNGKKNQQYFVI